MRAVILDIPQAWLQERATLGHDRLDEMWDGVLHMVPSPNFQQQRLGTLLVAFLEPRLSMRGVGTADATGVHRPGSGGKDFRVPDALFFSLEQPELMKPHGLEGSPLAVVEIRAPNDETYEKLDFWAKVRVPEVIVIEPERRTVEVLRLAGDKYLGTWHDDSGRAHARTLDVRFATLHGTSPRLRVEHDGEVIEI